MLPVHAWAGSLHTALTNARTAVAVCVGWPAAFLRKYPGVRVRILGLDPGICNLYFAVSLFGERFRYSQGDYRSHAKLEASAARRAAWARGPAGRSLPELPAVRRPFLSIRRAYSDVVLASITKLTEFYGSERQRHASLNVRICTRDPPCAPEAERRSRACALLALP